MAMGAFKSLMDSAKALKDMNDAHVRHGAVIELQEKIFAAQATQTALLEQVGELEKEVADFEAWEADKQRYEMSTTKGGSIVYRLKPGVQPAEPTHDICATCYQRRRKSILQPMQTNAVTSTLAKPNRVRCFECKAELVA